MLACCDVKKHNSQIVVTKKEEIFKNVFEIVKFKA